MSGGVDSSVAALLLQQQGYRVIGAFMKNFSDTKSKLTGECAWVEERKSALRIAALLGIPLITLDYEREYKMSVIEPMFAGYKRGLTPNPDILCNTIIKFPFLWEAARKHKADFIATGHYARIRKTRRGLQLLRGKDRKKDQSYFLAELSQADLEHTLFPLGNLTKHKVRAIAKKHHFPNWNKPGTRGICFVGKQDMQAFLKKRIKEKRGVVKSPEGVLLGTHRGISFYTIGQKAGEHVGIILEKPHGLESKRFYVASKNMEKNELIVASEGHPALLTKTVTLAHFYRTNPRKLLPLRGLRARIRHLGKLHAGTLTKNGSWYTFTFAAAQEAVAPGQRLVLYKGEQVVASGEIRL